MSAVVIIAAPDERMAALIAERRGVPEWVWVADDADGYAERCKERGVAAMVLRPETTPRVAWAKRLRERAA
jgi:hypothetical protein